MKGEKHARRNLPHDVENVLAEADKLIREIDSMVIEDIHDTQRIEFEKRCQALKNCRSNFGEIIEEKDITEGSSSYAEGFHQAYRENAQAMKSLKELLN